MLPLIKIEEEEVARAAAAVTKRRRTVFSIPYFYLSLCVWLFARARGVRTKVKRKELDKSAYLFSPGKRQKLSEL